MPSCPRCEKPVDSQAVICPHCKNTLKAFGHPGIPLHQSRDDSFLCDRCSYHLDDTCNFPKRPYAKSCTLFQDAATPLVEVSNAGRGKLRIKHWLYRYRGAIAIAFLILLSVALAL